MGSIELKYVQSNNVHLLHSSIETLLYLIADYVFPFQGYMTFAEMIQKRGIDICIIDRESFIYILEQHHADRHDNERLYKRIDRDTKDGPMLLGFYTPMYLKNEKRTIFLLQQNIELYSFNNCIEESSLYAKVLTHELMHAYFDSINESGYFPLEEIEEAMAELGTLAFLKNLDNHLYGTAHYCISLDKGFFPHYYYGLEYFDTTGPVEIQNTIEHYRRISNWIDAGSQNVEKFCSLVRERDHKETIDDLFNSIESILGNWDKKKAASSWNQWHRPREVKKYSLHSNTELFPVDSEIVAPEDSQNTSVLLCASRDFAKISKAVISAAINNNKVYVDDSIGCSILLYYRDNCSKSCQIKESYSFKSDLGVWIYESDTKQYFFHRLEYDSSYSKDCLTMKVLDVLSSVYNCIFNLIRIKDEYALYGPSEATKIFDIEGDSLYKQEVLRSTRFSIYGKVIRGRENAIRQIIQSVIDDNRIHDDYVKEVNRELSHDLITDSPMPANEYLSLPIAGLSFHKSWLDDDRFWMLNNEQCCPLDADDMPYLSHVGPERICSIKHI